MISTEGAGQELHFLPSAVSNRHSANYYDGDDIRLHIGIRIEGATLQLIANDRIGETWGKRVTLGEVSAQRSANVVVHFSDRQAVLQFGDEEVAFRPGAKLSLALELHTTTAIDVRDMGSSAEAPDESSPAAAAGFLDFVHTDEDSGLLILAGWFRGIEAEHQWSSESTVVIVGSNGEHVQRSMHVWFERPDLGGAGIGCLFTIQDTAIAAIPFSEIVAIRIISQMGDPALLLNRITGSHEHSLEAALDILDRARGEHVRSIRALLTEEPAIPRGADAESSLEVETAVEPTIAIAHAIVAPGVGLVLIGSATPYEQFDGAPLQASSGAIDPVPLAWRATAVGEGGFVAFAAMQLSADHEYRVESHTGKGGVTITSRDFSNLAGWPAMREILDAIPSWPDDPDDLLDRVIGRPLIALNEQRLAPPITIDAIEYGEPIESPRSSIIVPLFGRLDFMTFQLALFSADRRDVDEVVYVLDQPERRDEFLVMAGSAFARFRKPFRVILPSEGRGFGPASNVGLDHARGEYVCFLNSDVFPSTGDWLDHMIAALSASEDIGVVGARLLFADGSIQHQGMAIEAVAAVANWLFPQHPNKGLRPIRARVRIRDVDAVTGACMVMRRSLAEELGGFDPIYAIGDFEDADLCARIKARALRCVMNDNAILYISSVNPRDRLLTLGEPTSPC
jgi:GT2 family glycosyltransferase